MNTIIERQQDSIALEVRLLKEENAAEHGFDLRKIAAAARTAQRGHPQRMVTRIPDGAEQAKEGQTLTRPASKDELGN